MLVVMQRRKTKVVLRTGYQLLTWIHMWFLPLLQRPPSSKCTKTSGQSMIELRGWSRELRWTQEFISPHFKPPLASEKLGGKNGTSDIDKLGKHPSRRNFVPCVTPNSSYTAPTESKGYLIVYTNGGLNQMRTGGIVTLIAYLRYVGHKEEKGEGLELLKATAVRIGITDKVRAWY